jgi:hypothetical protein
MELPLRAVMDYLAGRIDRAEFERAAGPLTLDWLRRLLDGGSSVANVAVSQFPEEDDDGLILHLREYDAGAAPFRAPKTG